MIHEKLGTGAHCRVALVFMRWLTLSSRLDMVHSICLQASDERVEKLIVGNKVVV